jgi:predicted HTH transcriptional regulator
MKKKDKMSSNKTHEVNYSTMKYKIFVSGVQKELKAERSASKEVISEMSLLQEYFSVFLFEDLPAKSKPAEKIYLEEVGRSNIYLGILGNEYGATDKTGLSATEREFREARKRQKEILIFIKGSDDKQREPQVQALLKEIKNAVSGCCYKRFNSLAELKQLVTESLIDYLREQGKVGRNVFDQSLCEEAKLADLDPDKIKWFLHVANRKRSYPIDETTPIKDALVHLDLMKNGRLTNAAILLFGKEPQRFLIQAELKCIQVSGTEIEKPFASYQIYKGNMFDQINKAHAFVLDSIRQPVIQQEGTVQVKRPSEIPEFAIQEAIVNAVAHRDYHNNGAVQVWVFIDRVEIWNPGRLPAQLTIDSLKKPHTSYPNNPLLADKLYLADYIQKAGSGILEMVKQCRTSGLPEPEFIANYGEFRTILARDIFTESRLMKLGLNNRQLKAVKYVKEKGRITNQEYIKLCQTSKRTATRDLTSLTKIVFDKIGVTGKGTVYVLKTS